MLSFIHSEAESRNFQFVLLNIGHAIHHADWNYSRIKSPFARIYLVTEGEGVVSFENSEKTLKPGHLYLIPPFTLHSDSCSGPFSLYYLHLYEEQYRSISCFDQMLFPFEINAGNLDAQLFERLLQINPDRQLIWYNPKKYENNQNLISSIKTSKERPLHVAMETSAIILQLFSRFLADAKKSLISSNPRILNALKYIGENLTGQISLKVLSEMSCLTVDHFIRLFKQELKMTPVCYINQKRVEQAQLMLTISDVAIKDIAYGLSFENISYFNRLFKRYTGVTPVQFRKKNSF